MGICVFLICYGAWKYKKLNICLSLILTNGQFTVKDYVSPLIIYIDLSIMYSQNYLHIFHKMNIELYQTLKEAKAFRFASLDLHIITE